MSDPTPLRPRDADYARALLELRAENERLAAALRRIANGALDMARSRIRTIAVRALGGG